MARTTEDRLAEVQASFEAGFCSKAARCRALAELNLTFSKIRDHLTHAMLKTRTEDNHEAVTADYYAIPFDLHQMRDRHFVIAARYVEDLNVVRDMLALREAIKDAPLAPPPAKPEIEQKAEMVRRSVIEEMARRKTVFVKGLDITRLWSELYPRKDGKIALPVSVNAHIVHGHKGAVFVRHFFYLHGKLTPLNTILAIADTLEREASAA